MKNKTYNHKKYFKIVARLKLVTGGFQKGDYVFATKNQDADPEDRWRVGPLDRVVDYSNGKLGIVFEETHETRPFYYATKISPAEGIFLINYINAQLG